MKTCTRNMHMPVHICAQKARTRLTLSLGLDTANVISRRTSDFMATLKETNTYNHAACQGLKVQHHTFTYP